MCRLYLVENMSLEVSSERAREQAMISSERNRDHLMARGIQWSIGRTREPYLISRKGTGLYLHPGLVLDSATGPPSCRKSV